MLCEWVIQRAGQTQGSQAIHGFLVLSLDTLGTGKVSEENTLRMARPVCCVSQGQALVNEPVLAPSLPLTQGCWPYRHLDSTSVSSAFHQKINVALLTC